MKNKIKIIYDNPRFCDRYTVYTHDIEHGELFHCLSLSDNPDSPQGFSQWGIGRIGPHNGKEIIFKELPDNVQKHIESRLK